MKTFASNLILLFLIGFSFTSVAFGAGFGVFTHGASALGQANSVVAHGDSPSAVYFNPALLSQLSGTQLEFGTTVLMPEREFLSDASGLTTQAQSQVFFPSSVYLTKSFNDKISAGIGLFSPFGLGSDWGSDWDGRYIATKSEMQTYNVNPVVSMKVHPQVTIAAGVNVVSLDATLEQNVDLSTFLLPDGQQKFSGDGLGFGYNFGLLLDSGKGVTFGAAYRSAVHIDIEGDVSFTLPAPLLSGNAKAQANLRLPEQLVAGVAWQMTDRLIAEIGFRWEGWSAFDALRVNLAPPAPSATQPRDWHDTYTYNIGAKYSLNENWSLSAGYLYGETAVPDSTFEPAIPDADTQLITIGTDFSFNALRWAVSYGYQWYNERQKNNIIGVDLGGAANGRYESEIHMLALSVIYPF